MLKRNTNYVYKQNIIFNNSKKNLKMTITGHIAIEITVKCN